MMKSNKKLLSLVVVAMYVVCTLVAAPVQAYAATSGTHVTAKYYSKAQKAAQTKKALIALSKLPKSKTSAKAYDKAYEFDILQKLYKTANNEVYRAKNMGLNCKKFLNYGRLTISKARIAWLKDYFEQIDIDNAKPIILVGTIAKIIKDGDLDGVDNMDDGTILFIKTDMGLTPLVIGTSEFVGELSFIVGGKIITTEDEFEGTEAAIVAGDTFRLTITLSDIIGGKIEIRY